MALAQLAVVRVHGGLEGLQMSVAAKHLGRTSMRRLAGSSAVMPRGIKRLAVAGRSLRQARANCPLPAPAGRITAINSTPAAKAKPIIK